MRSVSAVLNQDYSPERMEVIVADGISTDRSRQIVEELVREHPQLRVVDNPGRIVSTALNLCIEESRGEIIIRVDGHAEVATDFVRENVALLHSHPEAWAVGGPIVHSGRNTFAKAVALAMAHPVGVGTASHRRTGYEGYARGTAFPAIRRWVFSRIGHFDERLVRNQDDEFSYRILRAGGKIYVSPRVRYVYYVRESPRKLFRQYLQYGFWRIPVIRKHRKPTTKRQVAPPIFLLVVLALLVMGLLVGNVWLALALPGTYAAVLITLAMVLVPKAGFTGGMLVPVAIGMMHLAYALGFVYGLLCAFLRRHNAWDRFGAMSALTR